MKTTTTTFLLQPLPKSFGAIVTNVKLAEIDANLFDQLYQAWLKYALLIFSWPAFERCRASSLR